uniref:Pentraxin (PTX) domain-containing protein n=1 Tax=Branchiostoma floridae TaxID=7739 RepID=C3ZPI2_BRAFL|eukprot:XP_002589540.1 hypothetical protein BRAFLDRAFT_97038 [Branchiostoma floridae]
MTFWITALYLLSANFLLKGYLADSAASNTGARDNKGTEFILTFTENLQRDEHDAKLQAVGTTQTPATVTVEAPAVGFTTTFNVSFGEVKTVDLPRVAVELRGSGVQDKGIHVTASEEITVYGVFTESATSDAFLALPTDVLGTEHFASCSPPSGSFPSQIGVVGTDDGTTVSIVPKQGVTFDGLAYAAGQTITVTLDRLQCLQLQSDGDLTGSHITSDKSVAVFSGNLFVTVGNGRSGSGDHIVEMVPPVDTWGRQFVTVPLKKRTAGDVFRVIAARDNTQVDATGKSTTTLNAGDFWNFGAGSDEYLHVSATEPVMLMQYSKTGAADSTDSDPFMLLVPPVQLFAADYTFTTSQLIHKPGTLTHHVNIAIKNSEKDGLRLDGTALASGVTWTSIPGTDLAGTHMDIPPGTHTLVHTSPIVTFGVTVYGFSRAESYGYPAGLRLARIAAPCSPTAAGPGDGLDNDCDGRIDEELLDGQDNDGDGDVDEDLAAAGGENVTVTIYSTGCGGWCASTTVPGNFRRGRARLHYFEASDLRHPEMLQLRTGGNDKIILDQVRLYSGQTGSEDVFPCGRGRCELIRSSVPVSLYLDAHGPKTLETLKMTFPSEPSVTNYVEVHASMDAPLAALTVCMKLRVPDSSSGTLFSYATAESARGNEVVVWGRQGTTTYELIINRDRGPAFDLPIQANRWHHLCITWLSDNGEWAFYMDGQQTGAGSGLGAGHLVRANGVWILGQDPDTLGGGFSANEAHRGDLARFNVWDHVLSPREMMDFYNCNNGGNVIDWATVAVTPHMDVAFSQHNCASTDVQLRWDLRTPGEPADRFQGGNLVTMEYNLTMASDRALVNITLQFHSDSLEDLNTITISNSSSLLELNGNITGNVKDTVYYRQKLSVYINVTYAVWNFGYEQFLGPVYPNNASFAIAGSLPTFNISWLSEGNITFGEKFNMSIIVLLPRLKWDRLVVEVHFPTLGSILPLSITHFSPAEVEENVRLFGRNSTSQQSSLPIIKKDDRWVLELDDISTLGVENNFLKLVAIFEFTRDEAFSTPEEVWARVSAGCVALDTVIWTGAIPVTVVPRGKPLLELDASVTDPGNLGRGEMVTFNVDLRHDPNSTATAYNVTVKLISTPFVKFVSFGKLDDGSKPTVVLKANTILFKWPQLGLTDRLRFTFKMRIDPDQKERAGDHRFVGPVETLYRGTALPGKRLRTEAKLLQFFYKILPEADRRTVPVLSPMLGSLLGVSQAESQLYGVSHCGRAYMVSEDDGRNWYSVPRDDWTRARGADYVPAMEVREGENADGSTAYGTTWRANDTGILRLPAGETVWQQVASWT